MIYTFISFNTWLAKTTVVKMHAKLLVGLVLLITIGISMASAEDMDVAPQEQDIYIGGQGVYTITITCTDKEAGTHCLEIEFLNYTTEERTDKLKGTLTSNDVALSLIQQDIGYLNYSWNSAGSGTYTFQLTVEFNESATQPPEVGEVFEIYFSDSKAGRERVLATATAYATSIPELLTAALASAGFAVVILRKLRM